MLTKIFKEWLLPVIFGLLITMLISHFITLREVVSGPSMLPNLHDRQHIVLLKQQKIKRFSVIVFDAKGLDPRQPQHKDYVKRVIGLPGDKITYTKEGQLYINEKKTPQKFIDKATRIITTQNTNGTFTLKTLGQQFEWTHQSTTVPKNSYFVMGDNREVSNDSRYWGFVSKSHIKGVVHATPWSQNKNNINQ